MRTRENLAWAAGVICGEGCFSFMVLKRGTKNDRRIRLTVGQSSFNCSCPEILIRLQKILGFGAIYGPHKFSNPKWKPSYDFQVHRFKEVQAAIGFLWEWLTPEKKAQAETALRNYHAVRKLEAT